MRVWVGYASVHGSTAAIAERIGQVLERARFAVNVLPVLEVGSPRRYGAVVLGSAVHDRAWLPEASAFVAHHAGVLRTRPVWLFRWA